jgi:hypothetical protein
MMVRNAMRIIVLTILKLNDPVINKLLTDLPFATFFVNLSCYLRDMIIKLDLTHNTSNQQTSLSPTGTITFSSQGASVEDTGQVAGKRSANFG